MVALVLLVPLYIFIAEEMPGRALHAPELALDRVVPLKPTWDAAYGVFLRSYARDNIPEFDRRVAPMPALGVIGILGLGFACFWVAYWLSGTT